MILITTRAGQIVIPGSVGRGSQPALADRDFHAKFCGLLVNFCVHVYCVAGLVHSI